MSLLDTCSLKKSLPLLLALLVIAQIDLASAAAWPVPLLSLLHLTRLRTTPAAAFARAWEHRSMSWWLFNSCASSPAALLIRVATRNPGEPPDRSSPRLTKRRFSCLSNR